jgi:hypothetical protein
VGEALGNNDGCELGLPKGFDEGLELGLPEGIVEMDGW